MVTDLRFDAERLLGSEGLLAETLASYEYRPEQIEMSNHVYQALIGQAQAVIAAGPGVGKSLAN